MTPERRTVMNEQLDTDALRADAAALTERAAYAMFDADFETQEPLQHAANRALLAAEELDRLRTQLAAVHEALTRHPKCDKYDEDDVVSCGWKSAVRDITWGVSGKAGAL